MFSLKTIVTAIVGTGIAGSLAASPVRANQAESITNAELTVSQIYGERPSSNEPSDSWKNIVGLTGLAIGTGIVGYHVSKAYQPSLANSLPNLNNNGRGTGTTILARLSPKLRRELLRLVHNQATANRLLSGTANSHPGRSANWVAEKVIYDLKRDR